MHILYKPLRPYCIKSPMADFPIYFTVFLKGLYIKTAGKYIPGPHQDIINYITLDP